MAHVLFDGSLVGVLWPRGGRLIVEGASRTQEFLEWMDSQGVKSEVKP